MLESWPSFLLPGEPNWQKEGQTQNGSSRKNFKIKAVVRVECRLPAANRDAHIL